MYLRQTDKIFTWLDGIESTLRRLLCF